MTDPQPLTLAELQLLIDRMYSRKDEVRGIDGTFMWLMEEIGELAASLREESRDEQAAEFADVLAWLATLANVAGVDLDAAIRKKYGQGCPGCGDMVCRCDAATKP
ncbi:MAG: MazG nucleotide pyrophosphohydrolase domain-containing protein [Planctomycetaceae bacterium]